MNKPSQNKAESLIWGYPTAYKGTPMARFVYSINLKNTVFTIIICFYVLKGFFGLSNPKKPFVYLGLCGLHFFYSPFDFL